MVFPIAAAAARRQVGRRIVQQASQRRAMGGGHAPAPEWEGIDKVVRDVFPADYQRTCFIANFVIQKFQIPYLFLTFLIILLH